MSSLIVSLSRITAIEPHPNADRLDIATIKGWNCIVGKGQQKLDSLVIFIPPDSVVPPKLIEALKLDYLKKNGRVDTVKLRGVVSQGLVINPSQLLHPDLFRNVIERLRSVTVDGQQFNEDDNMAEVLGIKKYEPPEPEYGIQGPKKDSIIGLWKDYRAGELTLRRFFKKSFYVVKDSFTPKKKLNPLFDKYTDLENVKHYNTVFTEGEPVVITEKIHGTNFRAGRLPRYATGNIFRRIWQLGLLAFGKKYEFVYGSRTVQKTLGNRNTGFYNGDVYGLIANKYRLSELIPEDYIVYGEIYGTNPNTKSPIQKHYQYGETEDVAVLFFDVKYKGTYLDFAAASEFFQKLNLPMVPVLYRGVYVQKCLENATVGFSTLESSTIREGAVVKPEVETTSLCGRKILKSINPEYLLIKDNTQWH